MNPRIFHPEPLHADVTLDLSERGARHVQVLRAQPGDALTLFDGSGGSYCAVVERMGKRDVTVRTTGFDATERENTVALHIAIGMPANERMDWLVEKATELGVSRITPLLTERSVLRPSGERADKKRAHWQGIAMASCEQCGRNRVPEIDAVQHLTDWLRTLAAPAATAEGALPPAPQARMLLSLRGQQEAWRPDPGLRRVLTLSGPEGGLSERDEEAALAHGFTPAHLGARILRSETAPLAVLAVLATLNF